MNEKWTADNIPDLSGKVIIITGANSGIGFEAAREFARKGAEVIFGSRNQTKAENALEKIQSEIPDSKLAFIDLNLASLESIHNFAERFNANYQKLDILLNNAGIMLVPYQLTEDGFEQNLGINHLGHFALTGLLVRKLTSTQGSRIVNISSNAHYAGKVDFSNLMFEDGRDYSPMGAYGRSKLANLLFTYELQRRFQAKKLDVMALAAHPGISATGLAEHLFNYRLAWIIRQSMKFIFQSSAMGALPGIRAAVDPEAVSGQYYGPDGKGERSGYPIVVASNDASRSVDDARQLWKVSENLTNIKYLD